MRRYALVLKGDVHGADDLVQGNLARAWDKRVGPLPPVCASQPDIAFLIRTAGGRWIGNATVLR